MNEFMIFVRWSTIFVVGSIILLGLIVIILGIISFIKLEEDDDED